MIPRSSTLSATLSGELRSANVTWTEHWRGYELKINNAVVATLQQPSFWSSDIVASTIGGTWDFRTFGVLNRRVEILDAATRQLCATIETSWGGRTTLTFADGQTFELEASGWWHPVWSVTGSDGTTVLQLHKRERSVEVTNGAHVPNDRLLLTLYRIRQADQDASAAAIAAV
jgi:hypothetical protein